MSERQVTAVVHRLREQLSLLNPLRLVDAVAEVVAAIATPPPGDPDRLMALAAAYRVSASAIADLPPVGSVTDGPLARTPQVFTGAADALTELATTIRDLQRRHAELRKSLQDASYDATHAFGLPIPDPVGAVKLTRIVGGLISGCVEVYTESLAAADRAAIRFTDLGGRARAGASGLPPYDAITLAEQRVGVLADGYDDGVLTRRQLRRAGSAYANLGPVDREHFDRLATTDFERAWLFKALAAGHDLAALSEFAQAIRGKSTDWLDEHLSLIDRGAAAAQRRLGVDVRQYEDTTCGTTSLVVARAEHDPLYALALTTGDFIANFTAERARVHNETNVVYPQAIGTSPKGMAAYLTRYTGTSYTWSLADDTDRRAISTTLREIVTAVDRGDPVALLVGGPVPRHYVLVVGHQDGVVLVYEPTSGDTVAVPERAFLSGELKGQLGFDHVQAVVKPAS
ncbi:hypothetical protein [Actinokineospora sp. NBRC 105648]|uniref:hypothetical protein n=1 Tax=Actinokineospora sp. NBRC 105648 TaxID=3032206 RepID=UPI0024A07DBE|nr:hypothetical protein [Actinokineospora sp. NBRC 105648]GLZ37722.1 hypothetical protein Acsp05_13470 [Actinokineospora sp. NBRC 105648]